MFVADTNLLSELMKAQPIAAVVKWATETPIDRIFTTSINQAELLVGISTLPSGRRRTQLAEAAALLFSRYFEGKVLPFDSTSAIAFAKIVASRQSIGRPIEPFDAQIAAVVASNDALLVTRNVKHFADCGFEVLNPWIA